MLLIAVTCLWLLACSDKPNVPSGNSPAPAPTAATTATARPTVANFTAPGVVFTASPNPIKVCDGTGLGATFLTWKAPGASLVEIHVNAPDGPMPGRLGPEGTAPVHKWVGDGTVFYLQNVPSGAKPSAANTIGILTVGVTTAGCP
jgi:hypothetical protein